MVRKSKKKNAHIYLFENLLQKYLSNKCLCIFLRNYTIGVIKRTKCLIQIPAFISDTYNKTLVEILVLEKCLLRNQES